MTVQLRVDPIACDGFGYCAELLPERIRLDEWGFPIVEPGPVPAELLRSARAVVKACPRNALALDRTRSAGQPAPRATTPVASPVRRRPAPQRSVG